jgi:ATP synthase protein I
VASEPEDDHPSERRGAPAAPNWGLGLDLGIRLGVSVALGLGGGLLVDNWLHTSPVATLVGMVLGIGAAMVTIWRVASGAMRR